MASKEMLHPLFFCKRVHRRWFTLFEPFSAVAFTFSFSCCLWPVVFQNGGTKIWWIYRRSFHVSQNEEFPRKSLHWCWVDDNFFLKGSNSLISSDLSSGTCWLLTRGHFKTVCPCLPPQKKVHVPVCDNVEEVFPERWPFTTLCFLF